MQLKLYHRWAEIEINAYDKTTINPLPLFSVHRWPLLLLPGCYTLPLPLFSVHRRRKCWVHGTMRFGRCIYGTQTEVYVYERRFDFL